MAIKVTPFLWFDQQAEEAARFYTSVFPNSKITQISHYLDAGQETHGRAAGSVMTVTFELDGNKVIALNGGPLFKLSEAFSFVVECETQEEVDYYWDKLGAGGDPDAQACGWLKDKFGLSWQITPTIIYEMMSNPDPEKRKRSFEAMLGMKKLEIAGLKG